MILKVSSIVCWLILVYQDLKNMEVNSWSILFLLVNQLLLFSVSVISVTIGLAFYLFSNIIFNKVENYIGGADLKIFSILLLTIPYETIYVILFASLFGIITSLIFSKRAIPFIPCIFLAYVLVGITHF